MLVIDEFVTNLWSSDRLQRIKICRNGWFSEPLAQIRKEMDEAGCRFFSNDREIRVFLGIPRIEDEEYPTIKKREILRALRSGDHVFHMVHGYTSYHSFSFKEDDDPMPRYSNS